MSPQFSYLKKQTSTHILTNIHAHTYTERKTYVHNKHRINKPSSNLIPLDDNQLIINTKLNIIVIHVLNSLNLLIPNLNRFCFEINSKLTLGKRFWPERFIFCWDSLHIRLNNYCKVWNWKKKMKNKTKTFRKDR